MYSLVCPRSALVVMIAVSGCGGGGSTPAADGANDAGAEPDGGGAAPDGGDDGGSSTLSHCPVEPAVQGPALARVRWQNGIAFCVDSTEVTNAQYAAFLAAQVPLSTQGARCGWNKTFAPASTSTNGPPCPVFDATGRAAYPVVCVDWCDADAYCRWAGKRLCQKPGGGPVSALTMKDGSEWVIACTGDGAGTYPYGAAAAVGRCVDRQFPAAMPALQPVKAATMCEGGVPGLFDMSGNASEWQDDCMEVPGDGSGDSCESSGGSFSADLPHASCTAGAPFLRKQVAGDAGFRCCVDAEFF